MWRADGWGSVTRLGLLIPHADVGPESEIQAMAPAGVVVHATRVAFGAMAAGGSMGPTIPLAPVRAFAEPPLVDEAAELVAAAPIDAIGFAFTSSAYVIGVDGEAGMIARLRERTGDIPVTATCTAAVLALRSLGVQRLALFDPPWFDEQLSALGAAYFREWVRGHVPETAEGVFIGGNGFRAVGTIETLEADLGRPVLTANQVLLWHLLGLAGGRDRIEGYGRLLES